MNKKIEESITKILDDYAAGVVLEERSGIFLHECSYFKTALSELSLLMEEAYNEGSKHGYNIGVYEGRSGLNLRESK